MCPFSEVKVLQALEAGRAHVASRKAGVGPWLAWGTAYDGPGLWRAAGSPALTWTLTYARLTRLGFHSLHDWYQALAAG